MSTASSKHIFSGEMLPARTRRPLVTAVGAAFSVSDLNKLNYEIINYQRRLRRDAASAHRSAFNAFAAAVSVEITGIADFIARWCCESHFT